MKIKDYNIGPHRWHIDILPESAYELLSFKSWLMENCPNCMCKIKISYFDTAHKNATYYEVRSTNIESLVLIKLIWG
jgi:hypothetical protein